MNRIQMSQLGILQQISVSKIAHAPVQLRTSLEHLDELAFSIKKYGLLQPIVVKSKKSGYEVVAGNRRLAATRLLKLRKISCHIMELSEKEAYEIALIENIHQHTLNPIEEAIAFERYVKQFGWGGVTDLAKTLGKSQEFVSKRIFLLRLPERVREEIIRQRITPSVALEMLPLTNDESEQLSDVIINEHLTKERVRDIVKATRKNHSAPTSLDKVGPNSKYEEAIFLTDKSMKKAIISLKSTLLSFDDIAKDVEDQWLLRELITHYRQIIHGDIDTFIRLKRKLVKNQRLCVISNDSELLHDLPNSIEGSRDAMHIFFAP